jgi:hypothetical protein
MIAKIIVEGGKFTGGYVRGGDIVHIQDDCVRWTNKWYARIDRDAGTLACISTRSSSKGQNIVNFKVTPDGFARLSLETAQEERVLKEEQVFKNQCSLDGELFLVYNGNGYRSAFYHSNELIEWKRDRGLVNISKGDPNKLDIREKIGADRTFVTQADGLFFFHSGKRTLITDGTITLEGRKVAGFEQPVQFACLKDATWAIIEKERKNKIERVLVSEIPVFDLKVPNLAQERRSRVSTYDSSFLLKMS